MSANRLTQAVEGIPSLLGVFVTTIPECLLFDSWTRADLDWSAEEVAAYFGDLFRANREGLKALQSWSSDMQVTIEAPAHLVLLNELSRDFVCACVFQRQVALGMARLYNQRLLGRIAGMLPTFAVEERPRGVRVLEFLNRYAPDPHAVLLRASLRSGVPLQILAQPESLDAAQVAALETTACQILGLSSLNL